MHIVALTHLFTPARGGTEIALEEWAKVLVTKGHRISVVTSNQKTLEDFQHPKRNPELAARENREGIEIIRLPLGYTQRRVLAKTGALALRSRISGGERLWFMAHVPHLPGMIRAAEKLRPDLLYAVPFPTATCYYASVAAKRIGCPWVFQPHLHFSDINFYLQKVLRWIGPQATSVFTNTQTEKEFLIKQGLGADNIQVTGQGINLSLLDKRRGDGSRVRNRYGLSRNKVLLFLGRKVENKGIDLLLQAMPLIWQESPETALILAGQTSPYFQTLFQNHPLHGDPRIFSIDDFPEEDKADLLAACDLLILPSRAESFGVVFLEAWAEGKPVIGARIPAVEEMIDDGEDGFLVPYGDPAGLASAAKTLLSNPELCRVMGEKGKQKVEERFEIKRITERMETLFLSLLK